MISKRKTPNKQHWVVNTFTTYTDVDLSDAGYTHTNTDYIYIPLKRTWTKKIKKEK
jgi:hypothetical protein